MQQSSTSRVAIKKTQYVDSYLFVAKRSAYIFTSNGTAYFKSLDIEYS